ncbi:DUF4272 domain-containing protein [Variovorax atrisoli]|uniref:DUF4272 domain-containing protein n=1 Tax=Variovorax atrisoli TaxID=3394203 RepID=UPI003396658A
MMSPRRNSALLQGSGLRTSIFDAAYEIQEFHVVALQRRMSRPNYQPSVSAVDEGVVRERHHAINWLVGYCGQSWDDVQPIPDGHCQPVTNFGLRAGQRLLGHHSNPCNAKTAFHERH